MRSVIETPPSHPEERPVSVSRIGVTSIVVTVLGVAGQLSSFVLFAAIAAAFGASWETDAFFLAMSIPTLFTGALSNAITSVFVPVMTDCRVRRPEHVGRLVGSALLFVTAFAVPAALLVALLTPGLLAWTAPALSPAALASAAAQARLLASLVVTQPLAATLSAAFNSRGRFALPAGSVALRYLSTIGFVLLLRPSLGVLSLGTGFLLGSFLQVATLAAGWRRFRVPLELRWRLEPDLARGLRLTLPLILGTAALQLGVVITRLLAATLPEGSVSVLDYASRISGAVMELLTGGVLLVSLADWAETMAAGDQAALRAKLRRTALTMLALVLPAVACLAALRVPVVALALQRGRFAPGMAGATAAVLVVFLLGVPFDAVGRCYVRLFLARKETLLLGQLSFFRLASTLVLALGLIRLMDVRGLALAETISVTMVSMALVHQAGRRTGPSLDGAAPALLKLLAAAGSAGVAAWAAARTTSFLADSPLMNVSAGLLAGGVTYLLAAWVLRSGEVRSLVRLAASLRPVRTS